MGESGMGEDLSVGERLRALTYERLTAAAGSAQAAYGGGAQAHVKWSG